MAKKRSTRRSSKCPEPINTLLDLAGAAALRTYVKHKVKKDYAKGEGEASAKAAAMVFGAGSMRKGSAGIINLGGLMGLNSALKDIENMNKSEHATITQPFVDHISSEQIDVSAKAVPKYTWRQHCEDGTQYGLSPLDYETADDYDEALQSAKNSSNTIDVVEHSESKDNLTEQKPMPSKYIWRKYCSDGTDYGIDSEDYETADDYQDALTKALSEGKSPE